MDLKTEFNIGEILQKRNGEEFLIVDIFRGSVACIIKTENIKTKELVYFRV